MRKGLNCYKMNETDRAYLIDIFHRKKTIYALGLLISFLAHTQTYGQITSQKVDSLVKTAMTKFNVVGTAVAIVKDGKVIHIKGYGVKSNFTKEEIDENSLFAIASNSKAFTTTALAILVEEGKISWQDKVIEHIPEFKMYNDYVTQNFNIQDLVTHRSGLGLGAGDLMFMPDGSDFTIDDILVNFQHFNPKSAYRTKFDYDNLLYLVAGELIARKSGMTWEEFVIRNVLNPLMMDNTFPSLDYILDETNSAKPHTMISDTLRVLSNFKTTASGAAGGIFSSVSDICKWMNLHLNKGKHGEKLDKSLFSEESHNEMWRLHTIYQTNKSSRYNSHFAGYGLGWNLMDVKGNKLVYHTGSLPGVGSKIVMIPDINLGIAVFTNTEPGGSFLYESIIQSIIDSYLRLDYYNWIGHYLRNYKNQANRTDSETEKVWKTAKKNYGSSIELDKYTGIFKDKWFGNVEIFEKENLLWFKSHRSPKLNGPLYHYETKTYAIKWKYKDMNADALISLYLDKCGKASRILIKGISSTIDFSFDFQDLDFWRLYDDSCE